ncbi:type II toxin-antitoxin system RelE/ParE family toxin [Undibacterium sp. TJN25]|uniref:type II toxin-antitoxin system RelE/ParE family toxin n=1 Tax=Undibacterium sp. TJN25 TaxID=3413056 RepID=UPI003BF1664E
MKLEWGRFALEDRDKIFDYIEQDSPQAAIAVDERISDQIKLLANFPELGRTGRIEDTRELVITHTPYIIAYTFSDDTIRVLRVLHSAQLWPDDIRDI